MSTPLAGATALVIALLAGSVSGQAFDVVILNGRVMDPETMLEAVRNVGIADGRITAVTAEAIEGARVIDATGLVVAPGFIETGHRAFGPLDQKQMALDGTTTMVGIEGGDVDSASFYETHAGRSLLNYGLVAGSEPERPVITDGVTEGPPAPEQPERSLIETVRRVSYAPARALSARGLKAMDERGRLQAGRIADITIFTGDEASARGIAYVMVHGTLVVEAGRAIVDRHPGRPIRSERARSNAQDIEALWRQSQEWYERLVPWCPCCRPSAAATRSAEDPAADEPGADEKRGVGRFFRKGTHTEPPVDW